MEKGFLQHMTASTVPCDWLFLNEQSSHQKAITNWCPVPHLEAVVLGADLCKLVIDLLVLIDGVFKLCLQGLLVIHPLLQIVCRTQKVN